MIAGASFGLKPGHTFSIRRIERGLLSYQMGVIIYTNPFELGLDRLVNLNIAANFIGKPALHRIKAKAEERKQVGLVFQGAPLSGKNTSFSAITYKRKTI